ncbi:MAG: hypothetical protein MJZ70_03895 [Bacteroidales bacterium]|nr:hypothetical protein [Bacteroidales bacterium]
MKKKLMILILLTISVAGIQAQPTLYKIPVQRCEVSNPIVFAMLDSVKGVSQHCIFNKMDLPYHYHMWQSLDSTLCVGVNESGRLWNCIDSGYCSEMFYYGDIPVLVNKDLVNSPAFSSYFVPTADSLYLNTYAGALLQEYKCMEYRIPYNTIVKFSVEDNGFTWKLLSTCDCKAYIYEKVDREYNDEEFFDYFHCQRDSLLKNPQDSIRVGDYLLIEFYVAENGDVKARKWTVLSTAPARVKRMENCDWIPSKTVFKGDEIRRMALY